MKIASLSENLNNEKRVSITPDTVKKFKTLEFEVSLPEGYGNHLGFSNNDYKVSGANILSDDKEIINGADVVVQLGLPSEEKLSHLKQGQNLIGVLNPFLNKEKIESLIKKKQEDLLDETVKKIDIIICTALIPGKKAPIIIKDIMIDKMQPGSIIYDLAAIQGGNTSYTEVDKIIEKNGVKIMGDSNILNKLPTSASNLYSKNIFNFVSNLYDKENKKININLEDEIIEKTLIK